MSYLPGIMICILGAAVMFLPSLVGHFRHSGAVRNISALNALALLTLVCSLASAWSLLATGVLWAAALVLALVSPRLSAQPGAAPSGGPAEPLGNSGVSGRPPSVS